tara:strand:- start:486 stop:1130 length:645 start_codon:yes stop_codon:yes gene_type:complete
MDEDITIIDNKTRKERIINFFINNKKKIILIIAIIILVPIIFFSYQIYEKGHKEWLSEKYNLAVIEHQNGNESKIAETMKEIIYDKDPTYSPLALYFLIDNNVVEENNEINELFDIIINETNLEKEIKNLVIYKKGLFNSDFESENNLIQILNPVINSDSVWKSHALYLLAEYFYYKNQRQKSREFFNQILTLENSNPTIKIETEKRLNRDFSD